MDNPYNTNDNDHVISEYVFAGKKYSCPLCDTPVCYKHNNESEDSGFDIMCMYPGCENQTEHIGKNEESFLEAYETFKEKSTL